jgi:hypothetical protein
MEKWSTGIMVFEEFLIYRKHLSASIPIIPLFHHSTIPVWDTQDH